MTETRVHLICHTDRGTESVNSLIEKTNRQIQGMIVGLNANKYVRRDIAFEYIVADSKENDMMSRLASCGDMGLDIDDE